MTLEEAKTIEDLEKYLLDEIEAHFVLDAHAAFNIAGTIKDTLERVAELKFKEGWDSRMEKDMKAIQRSEASGLNKAIMAAALTRIKMPAGGQRGA